MSDTSKCSRGFSPLPWAFSRKLNERGLKPATTFEAGAIHPYVLDRSNPAHICAPVFSAAIRNPKSHSIQSVIITAQSDTIAPKNSEVKNENTAQAEKCIGALAIHSRFGSDLHACLRAVGESPH